MNSGQLGQLIVDLELGRKQKTDELFEVLHAELRRLAVARLRREKSGNSWHPTLLVNELYLEFLTNKALDGEHSSDELRRAFLGLSGFLMKRLLILHSRPLRSRVTTVGEEALSELPTGMEDPGSVVYIDRLLERLEQVDPRLRTVVELRVFHGRNNDEIASELGCSTRTVGSLWSLSRRWLETELRATAA